MRFAAGVLVGVVIGALLATAVVASAQTVLLFYKNLGALRQIPDGPQAMYVAGAIDGIESLKSLTITNGPKNPVEALTDCNRQLQLHLQLDVLSTQLLADVASADSTQPAAPQLLTAMLKHCGFSPK